MVEMQRTNQLISLNVPSLWEHSVDISEVETLLLLVSQILLFGDTESLSYMQ